MANDRLSQIEARFEAKSESRDQQLAEISSALATIAESVRNAEGRGRALEARLSAIEQSRPGIAALWGPAGLIGSLLAFVLWQAVAPLHDDIERFKGGEREVVKLQAENIQHLRDVDARMDAQRQQLLQLNAQEFNDAEVRGRLAEMQHR